MQKINLKDKINEIKGRVWHPVDVAKVNNQVVRMALFKGEYHWHKHKNEDELFFVVKGRMTIQINGKPNINLQKGQMAVVSKGVEHCPKSSKGAYVLMFEPFSLKSKGD